MDLLPSWRHRRIWIMRETPEKGDTLIVNLWSGDQIVFRGAPGEICGDQGRQMMLLDENMINPEILAYLREQALTQFRYKQPVWRRVFSKNISADKWGRAHVKFVIGHSDYIASPSPHQQIVGREFLPLICVIDGRFHNYGQTIAYAINRRQWENSRVGDVQLSSTPDNEPR